MCFSGQRRVFKRVRFRFDPALLRTSKGRKVAGDWQRYRARWNGCLLRTSAA